MTRLTLPLLVIVLALGGSALAQQPSSLTGATSDPKAMGWMQGFPPPADKVIRFTDPDYFSFPKLRWTVCNFRQLMPTAVVRGAGAARLLPKSIDPAIDGLTFAAVAPHGTMTWKEAFEANYTDGIIVLHQGRIVYERYGGCMKEDTLHGAMSVTKSITGLLAEMLVVEGVLDETSVVGDLIPELRESAFGDATVRQVIDMTTALDYSEDYADPDAEVWAYAQAGSSLQKPTGYKGPRSYFEFLETIQKSGTHGTAFGYKTVNADVLGWLIARTSRRSTADLLSDRIWSRIGAEREAFYTVDSIGTPFAGGGFNATLRDMARLGQLMLEKGQVDGKEIVPRASIEKIRRGGDPDKFEAAGYDLPGWSYGSMWWISNDDHGAYAARGVHGQTIWIDPEAEMVIVRFASHPVAANAASDPTSLPAFRAVADYLISKDEKRLPGSEWVIEDIGGRNAIDGSQASLSFLPEGRVAGGATCNRIIGSYEAEETRLAIALEGTTMMACPEALMNQERRFLDLLPRVTAFRIDDADALILTTADGTTLTGRRVRP